MSRTHQVCTRCVMDTSAIDISFDEKGVCNYCNEFLERSKDILNKSTASRTSELGAFVAKVKAEGKGKKYDCIIGVSGGVDSSWALVQAVKLGLRPLAVHMDNGWNSELAQNNISNLVQILKVDLHTHVIDWNEYKKLMQAFFDANVIDVELLYDNAMLAVNYEQAKKCRIKYILAGTNQSTEGMNMPKKWNWFKLDAKNIRNIGKQFGNVKLKTFPSIGTINFIWSEYFRKIKWISFLDYFDYNKAQVLEALQKDYNYKPYPYKHYESIFTRFYQGYILPTKFFVDKRRLHLSTLVVTKQMSREEAMKILEDIPYPSVKDLANDRAYFLKKMGWAEAQLENYLSKKQISHEEFGSEKPLWNFCHNIYRQLSRMKKLV